MKRRTKILSLISSIATFVCTLTLSLIMAFGGKTLKNVSAITFPKEADYAYSFVVVGDPQYLGYYDYLAYMEDQKIKNGVIAERTLKKEVDANGNSIYETAFGGSYTKTLYKWIADNKDKYNIQFAMTLGDMGHIEATEEYSKVAQPALQQLTDAGIPYSVVRGNHDNRKSFFDTTIGISTSSYMNQSTLKHSFNGDVNEDGVKEYDYKGYYNDGTAHTHVGGRNTIHEVVVDNVKYLLVALDFGAQDPILEWANYWVGQEQYKDHIVIVSTHGYSEGDGNLLDGTQSSSPTNYDTKYANDTWGSVTHGKNAKILPDEPLNDGVDIWDKFISKHANISMVFSGHVETYDVVRTTRIGDNGNVVQEFCVNAQCTDDDGWGGASNPWKENAPTAFTGMVAVYFCSEDGRTMDVRFYSTINEARKAYQGVSVEDGLYDNFWAGKASWEHYTGANGSQYAFSLEHQEWKDGEGMVFSSAKQHTVKMADNDPVFNVLPNTVEFSLKLQGTASEQFILGGHPKDGVAQADVFGVRLAKNNTTGWDIVVYGAHTGDNKTPVLGSRAIPEEIVKDGQYHTYAITFTGTGRTDTTVDSTQSNGGIFLYIDGKPWNDGDGLIALNRRWHGLPTDPYVIGGDYRDENKAYLKCPLKWLALYSDVRTANELRADTTGYNAKDESLMVAYDFVDEKDDHSVIGDVKQTTETKPSNNLVLKAWNLSTSGGWSFEKGERYIMKKGQDVMPKSVTVSLQIPTTGVSDNQYVFGNYDGVHDSFALFVGPTKDGNTIVENSYDIGFYIYSSSVEIKQDDGSIKKGAGTRMTWKGRLINDDKYHTYQFAFADDYSSATLYVDGAIVSNATRTLGEAYRVNPTLPYVVGAHYNGSEFDAGKINWFALHADARTAAEFASDATGAVDLSDDNLMIALDFGAVAKDGKDVKNLADASNPLYAPGLEFASGGKTWKLADHLQGIPRGFEAVIQYNGTAQAWIASNYYNSSSTRWGVRIEKDTGYVYVWLCKANETAYEATFEVDVRSKYYKRIGVTWDYTNTYLYIDGELVDQENFNDMGAGWAKNWYSSMPMVVGGTQYEGATNASFIGRMKSIAFFFDARKAKEMKANYETDSYDLTDGYLMAAYDLTGVKAGTKVIPNLKEGGMPLVSMAYATLTDTLANETYTDIADLTAEHKDKYVMGIEHESTQYRQVSYSLAENGIADNVGVQFTLKSKESKAEMVEAINASKSDRFWSWVNVRLGYSFIEINLSKDASSFGFRAAYFHNKMNYYAEAYNLLTYEDGAEYVFRFTRTAIDTDIDYGMGAMIRIYGAKINPATGMPADGWDSKPLCQFYALHERNSTAWETENNISVQPGPLPNDTVHTVTFSSYKYVGVKVLGEMTTLNRGDSYTFASDPNVADDEVLVGYSQGAESYSESDFAQAGTTEKIVSSQNYTKAMYFTLTETEKASLAFKRVMRDGELQPVEAALRWRIEYSNYADLLEYFGTVSFGYRMWAQEGGKTVASAETVITTLKQGDDTGAVNANVSKTNLQKGTYDTQFLCRGYLQLGTLNTTFYASGTNTNKKVNDTLRADVMNSFTQNLGRSASYVAEQAVKDVKDEQGVYGGYDYKYQVTTPNGETKYSYLPTSQYDLLKAILAGQA